MTDYERLVLRMNIVGGIFQDIGVENITENDLENIAKHSDTYKRFVNDYVTYGIDEQAARTYVRTASPQNFCLTNTIKDDILILSKKER